MCGCERMCTYASICEKVIVCQCVCMSADESV